MFGLWAVATHTFRQCLRMKVAGLFVLLLAIAVGAMPFLKVLKGDGTLAGQIQTFLSYSTSLTAVVLSLMTIFLATHIVAEDVRNKQIYSVATKPVARWQYIIGRWLGVVLLNAAILVAVSGAIYGLAQYLRAGESLKSVTGRAEDRRKVETEVFAARVRVPPEPVDLEQAVRARIERDKAEGRYGEALEAYKAETGGDDQRARKILETEIRKQVSSDLHSVSPGGSMVWRFSGIRVAGAQTEAGGKIVDLAREVRLVMIEADPLFMGRLIYKGPVRINGVDGIVERLGPKSFAVRFSQENMSAEPVKLLEKGRNVRIAADATFQITYTANPASSPPDRALASQWEVQNPTDGLLYLEMRSDAAALPATLTVSSRMVDAEGRTLVRYFNLPRRDTGLSTSVTILPDDVAVLYRVGGFGSNLARGMALVFSQLAFLAALGVLAGSFVSFPVACLLCFSMLPFQVAREFLLDAVKPIPLAGVNTGILAGLRRQLINVMNALLPDFNRTLPAEALVDGMNISWDFFGKTFLLIFCVQTVVVLVVACLIFRKRELARAQV